MCSERIQFTALRALWTPKQQLRDDVVSSWQLTGWFDLVISLAYLSIATIVGRGLFRTRQLGSNRLGVGTAAIFLTCGVAHGHQAVELLGGGSLVERHGGRISVDDNPDGDGAQFCLDLPLPAHDALHAMTS